MDSPDPCRLVSVEGWQEGPVLLGVRWHVSPPLVRAAASLSTGLGVHLLCAFVDPASYLTEWESGDSRTAASLDPAADDESQFPSGAVLQNLAAILGPPGADWSFRVLNGDVAPALGRLADSAGASLLIVGGPRAGVLAGTGRLLEGPVSASLIRSGHGPVLIVPSA